MDGPNYNKLVESFPTVVEMNPSIKVNHGVTYPIYQPGVDIISVVISVLVPRRAASFNLSNGSDVSKEGYGLSLRREPPVMPDSWTHNTHIETYVGEGCKVWIKNDSVLAFIPGRDLAPCARLASAFPMLFPGMFKDAPLTADETRFLQLISKCDLKRHESDEFERLCGMFYEKLGVEGWSLKKSVHILVSGNTDTKIKEIRTFIDRKEQDVETLQRQISQLIDDIKDQELRLFALMSKNDGEFVDELVDFLRHSNIRIDSSNGNTVQFTVRTILGCYVEGEVKSYVLNNDTVLSGRAAGWYDSNVKIPYTKEQMKLFYKAVFDHKIDIKMAARYSVGSTLSVSAQRSDQVIDQDYINNPNIGRAGCLGGYSGDLSDAKRNGDPMAVLAICQQSASSVNLGEIWPMAVVTIELVESTGKVIHTPNGDITFREAMEMILKEDESK